MKFKLFDLSRGSQVSLLLLALLQIGNLVHASAQNHTPGAVCEGHEVGFGANLQSFPGLKNLRLSRDEQLNQMRLPYLVLLNAISSLGPNALTDFFVTYQTVTGSADSFKFPSRDAAAMVDFTAVYVAVPQVNRRDSFQQYLGAATKIDRDGMSAFTWREVSVGDHEMYYATRLIDGTLVISNQEKALAATVKDITGVNSKTCSSASELMKKPYWLFRESKIDHKIPLGDASLQERLEWVSLGIEQSRTSEIRVHSKVKADRPLPQIVGTSLTASGADYVVSLSAETKLDPNFWAGVLSVFGFDVFI